MNEKTPKPQFEHEYNTIKKLLLRQFKRSQRQCEKSRENLKECMRWEEIQHEAELLQNNYTMLKRGLPEIVVWDWQLDGNKVIRLDPKLTPQQEVAFRFKQCKKLRKGIPYVEERLKQHEAESIKIQQWLTELETIDNLENLIIWRENIPTKPPQQQKNKSTILAIKERPFFEYQSAAGLKIWVGKKAKDNEILTFTLARGFDWWLHAAGYPGSHVIIRTNKQQDPDEETIQDAIQLALHHSKARDKGEGEVCITQRKYVSRFGQGHIGKVQISKHKTIFARVDTARYQSIKDRLHL